MLFTADGQEKMIGGLMNITFTSDDVETTARMLKEKGIEFVQGSAEGRLGNGGDLQGS